jgi:transcriptional regulator with XRE-family HTH domain
MTDADALATQLRCLRYGLRHWTRAELARRSGVSAELIGRIERGQANPRLDVLARLAHALGVTVAVLLHRPTPPPPAPEV